MSFEFAISLVETLEPVFKEKRLDLVFMNFSDLKSKLHSENKDPFFFKYLPKIRANTIILLFKNKITIFNLKNGFVKRLFI